MSKRLAFWLLFLSLALAVGAGCVWARDHYGSPRPCAQCKRSVRTPVGVEVPLHKGCRARYADAQIEN